MPIAGRHHATLLRRFLAVSAIVPSIAMGQTVRGAVTEFGTSRPAFGAIVTLMRVTSPDAGTREVRSVLVNERGVYHVVAPSAGSYRVLVRRIATRPFISDTFRLVDRQVRTVDVVLEPIRLDGTRGHMLDRVTVTGATPCETGKEQARRVADLWENARTALMSTAISARDSLVQRRVIRYERSLDAATLAIEREDVRLFDAFGGASGGFFRSISGDSLSKAGYWQRIGAGVTRYHGPDESALLSDAFLTDHCFTVDEPNAEHPGLTGLGFEPAPHRRRGDTPPEIKGTIWLDSTTSELRTLEFTWLTFPYGVPTSHLGGHVRYSKLGWGPWFVQRWWLRMPDGAGEGGTPTRRFSILEEGGVVQTSTDSLHREAPATITGIIKDPSSAPLADAVITVSGTDIRATSDAQGRFTLGAVPAGLQVIVVDHARYATLGVPAAEMDVLLDAGTRRALQLTARPVAEIPVRLCGDSIAGGQGTLRLTVLDGSTKQPIPDLRVTLAERGARASGKGYLTSARTDAQGVVLFCGAPAERLLQVTTGFDARAVAFELALPSSGMKARVLMLERR